MPITLRTAISVLACAVLLPASARAIDATIEAISGGVVITENSDPTHPNQLPVDGIGHRIVVPYDELTGLPSSDRQHKPFTIARPIDKATPLFYKACSNNETVETMVIRMFRTDAGGARVNYFTYELEDAKVVSCSTGAARGSSADVVPVDQISFTYQKITWTWNDGTLEHTDDWVAAR